MNEHVILVAFTVEADTRAEAHDHLLAVLPAPNDMVRMVSSPPLAHAYKPHRPIDSWWVAEDDRTDRSDNDSAVFVHMGSQPDAARHLHRHGLTAFHNVPKDTVESLVANGWTPESAMAHVDGDCDHMICTGNHDV